MSPNDTFFDTSLLSHPRTSTNETVWADLRHGRDRPRVVRRLSLRANDWCLRSRAAR